MKQIEHLPAVVLCATLVLPFRPKENSAAPDASPPGAAGCKANQASEGARGVPPAVRSSARRVASSSFERNPRSAI
jgi:hypothetical protein